MIIRNKYDIICVYDYNINPSIYIEEDKNTRWIKSKTDLSFKDWLEEDKSVYDIKYNIPFFGHIDKFCNLAEDIGSRKIIGCYNNEKDLQILIESYNRYRWKYIYT